VKNEDFSVMLPALPAMTTGHRILSPKQEREERTIGAYATGVAYAIEVYSYPDKPQTLEEVIAEFRMKPEDFSRALSIGKIYGKEYASQSEDVRMVSRFYSTGQHIYVLRVLGSPLGNADTGIPKFFESFKIEKDSQTTSLEDGAGDQSEFSPTADEIFSGKVVNRKVRVLSKPEPTYTEQARKHEITGTVVIRCVFSSRGTVTNLHVVSGLPDGLDDRALIAARRMKFLPAVKDGHFVSMWMELQYNFNLY
jgi:TonB family protein